MMCEIAFIGWWLFKLKILHNIIEHEYIFLNMTQGKIDLRNESGRPMKVKVVGGVSEKWN